MNLKQGTQLQGGRYRIEKVLGQGGFGITYLGVQASLDDKVAIKEFFMKEHCNRNAGTSQVTVGSTGSHGLVENFRNKFIKEARNIRKLRHHNIVNIIDVFEENGTAYYVMEYLEGGNLDSRVKSNGPLDEATAVACIRQVADALAEVHSNKLLHLDLKPENIMLNGKGEAVLIDFGIAKHYDNSGAQTTSGLIGTSEGYAPLEQYEAASLKTFTPATDIYALGATLFFLLTGTRPPKASEVMNLGLPEFPANVSQNVRRAIETAMQPTVRMRPQSVRGFMELLDDMGKTEIVIDDVTVIDTPVVPEPQPEIKQEQKVKWMDFAEFCDKNGYSWFMGLSSKLSSKLFPFRWLAIAIWVIAIVCDIYCDNVYGDTSYEPFSSKIGVTSSDYIVGHYDYEKRYVESYWHTCKYRGPLTILFYCLSGVALILAPFAISYRLVTNDIRDIEDTGSSYKITRNSRRFYGLSKWGKHYSRNRLPMEYIHIKRVSDEVFIVQCKHDDGENYGLYDAAKSSFVIPLEYESIELKSGCLYARNKKGVSKFTDKGYRVVE